MNMCDMTKVVCINEPTESLHQLCSSLNTRFSASFSSLFWLCDLQLYSFGSLSLLPSTFPPCSSRQQISVTIVSPTHSTPCSYFCLSRCSFSQRWWRPKQKRKVNMRG